MQLRLVNRGCNAAERHSVVRFPGLVKVTGRNGTHKCWSNKPIQITSTAHLRRNKQAMGLMNKIVSHTLPLFQVNVPESNSCSPPARGDCCVSNRSVPKYARAKTQAESNLCESPSSEASHREGIAVLSRPLCSYLV